MLFQRLFLAAVCVASVAGLGHAAPITYNFVDYAADQAGHTLSGTITTDGTIGFLSSVNIASYSVSIAGPHPQSWTSGDVGVDVAFSSADSIQAFADRLEFDASAPGGGSPRGFTISFNDPISPGTLFRTLRYRSAFLAVAPIYEATNSVSPPSSWSTVSPTMNGTTDWVIATAVPEPSTLALLGLGAAALLGYRSHRKRSSRRGC